MQGQLLLVNGACFHTMLSVAECHLATLIPFFWGAGVLLGGARAAAAIG